MKLILGILIALCFAQTAFAQRYPEEDYQLRHYYRYRYGGEPAPMPRPRPRDLPGDDRYGRMRSMGVPFEMPDDPGGYPYERY